MDMGRLYKNIGFFLFAGLLGMALVGRNTPVFLSRQKPETIEVQIKGEVLHPGLYSIPNGSSIQDLIAVAGGLKDSADPDDWPLGREVRSQEVIFIRAKTESGQPDRISINTADQNELMELPGIGEASASRILAYRELHPFTCVEELMNVPGIGQKKFEKLRDRIRL